MPGSSPFTTAPKFDPLPDRVAERQRRGLEVWSSSSMPHRKDEDWKYVDLDFAVADFRPATDPDGELDGDEYLDALGDTSGLVTMVDGALVAAESAEVTVGSILALSENGIAGRYGTTTPPDVDIFSAANHAFAPPGAAVLIPAGRTISSPVVVDVQAVADGRASFPHITVVAEPDSEASVVVLYRSAPGAEVLVCPIVEAILERSSRLSVSVIQHLADSARIVAHHHYVAGPDATVRIDEVGLGGRYARQRLGISLDGVGSSAKMGGIYFGDRSQVLDYRIHVTHRGPRTTSNIFLKGAVADTARAVWTGLMRIENEAVGTSAFETNRNLVLSDGAKINSVPNLEILTDDLQCGHGSSSGPPDEGQLYYLMSRGLPKDVAERLLVRGFFDEILADLAVPDLAAPSRVAVADKFAGAQRRGGF